MNKSNRKCRLCDLEMDTGFDIFGKNGLELLMADIIVQHFSLKLNTDDVLSTNVCKKCWKITDKFHKLYCIVKRVETMYLEAMSSDREEKLEPTDKNAYLQIKEELDLEPESKGSLVDTPGEMFNESIKNEDSIDIDTEFSNTVFNRNKKVNKIKEAKHPVTLRSNAKNTEEKEAKIRGELEMICEKCNKKYPTFGELKRHIRVEHNIPGYVRCCGQKFFRIGRIYTHILDHSKFGQYKCDECNKIFIDKQHLTIHIYRHNPLSKKYECSYCCKRFLAPSLLNEHLVLIHKSIDNADEFICDICGKSFLLKKTLAAHIHATHTQKYFVMCDICAKLYPNKKLLDYHRKTVHMKISLPKVQCTICGTWLSHVTGLNKHVKRVHTDKQVTCNVCGKVAPNKEALRSHIRYVHKNERFNCTICNKAFKSPVTLKEHMSSHTGNSLYKCKYCSMDFNSSGNMYSHRKKMHPIEWQMDKDRRNFVNRIVK